MVYYITNICYLPTIFIVPLVKQICGKFCEALIGWCVEAHLACMLKSS